jgi:hypothetical protein
MAETSDRLSRLAARYARYSAGQLILDARDRPETVAADVRSMAASLLRQDETKGLRGLARRIMGGTR